MDINATILGEMITFIIFIWLTMKYVWPQIIKALEARQKKIADGLAAADRGEKSLGLARQKAAEMLSDAKSQASKIMDGAGTRANQLVDDAKNRGREEGNRLIQNAKSEIQRERQETEEQLRKEAVQLALLAAEKVIGKSVNRATHERMVEELIEGM